MQFRRNESSSRTDEIKADRTNREQNRQVKIIVEHALRENANISNRV